MTVKRLAWWSLGLIMASLMHGQDMSIHEHIRQIESNSSLVFNYDVDAVSSLNQEYDWEGNYSLEKIIDFFRNSALDINLSNDQILVLPMQKKTYHIRGTLRSKEMAQSLAYASLFLEDGRGTYSDVNGDYVLNISAYKNELIRISYIGFEDIVVMVQDLLSHPELELVIDDNIFTENIVITGYVKRGIQEGSSYNSLVLNNRASFSNAEVIDQDIFREIQRLPGISSPDESATRLNIRGSSFDHNLISWEGLTLYDDGHVFGMISSINPFSLAKTHIYKSSHSAAMDNRIGGVVELFLSDEVPDHLRGSAGTNLTEAHLNLDIPVVKNKLSLFIAGRQSLANILDHSPTLESFNAKLFENVYDLLESEEEDESSDSEFKIDFYDLNAKVIFAPSDKVNFQSSYYNSGNSFSSGVNFLIDDFQISESTSNNSKALMNKLTLNHRANSRSEISHSVSLYSNKNDYFYNNLEDDQDELRIEQENDVRDVQLNITHTREYENSDLSFGIIVDQKTTEIEVYEDSRFSNRFEDEEEVKALFYHLFTDFSIRHKKAVLQLGIRNSYSGLYNDFNFSPRANLRYELNEKFHAKISLGLYNQYIRQLYDFDRGNLNLNNTLWVLHPNEDADILSSKKLSIGAIYNKNEWMIDFETYLNQNTGISSQNPNVTNDFILDDDGETRIIGADFIVNRTTKKFQNSVFYTFSKNSALFPSLDDDMEFFPSNIDQTHIFRFSNNYRSKLVDLNVNYSYKSGLPFSEPNILESDEEEENDEEEYYELDLENLNQSRLRPQHRLDLGLQVRKKLGRCQIEAGISVLNVLNSGEISSRKFQLSNLDEEDDDPELVQVEQRQLPRTIIAQVRIEF